MPKKRKSKGPLHWIHEITVQDGIYRVECGCRAVAFGVYRKEAIEKFWEHAHGKEPLLPF